MASHEYNEGLFAELVLYVAKKCEGDPTFGAVKLNKILYYCDFFAYRQLGMPITGAEYQALRLGPAPRRLLPVQRRIEQNGDGILRETEYGIHTQKRLIALRDADLTGFSGPEIGLVDTVIDVLKGHSAGDVTEVSHFEPGWQLAEEGETIPYEAAFVSLDPLSLAEERQLARAIAEREQGD